VTAAALKHDLDKLGFPETVFGRRRLYLAPELAGQASSIDLHLKWLDRRREPASGNRRSAFAVQLDGLPPMFMRRYRRGGMMRFLVSDLYVGEAPRPLQELAVTLTARKRGLPVAQPLGAAMQWLAPGLYRGWFLTRALEGRTLWDLLLYDTDQATRRQALEQARVSIERLHEGGLYHADLNFHNLFVCEGERPLRVVVLDLDKARLYPAALPQSLRRANFKRLARSARRLAAAGAVLSGSERDVAGLHLG
jgi:lipopolysaccharide kinase (Kdo/WaaP) family protein